jgi:putative transposase
MKYAFVECQRRQHAVRTLCRALRVSPSGYYAARSRSPSARDQRQSSLTTKIRDVHLASRQTYGAPRVHAELSGQGIACCRNTVAKLMRRAQIVPKAIRRFRVTTDSRNTKEVFPNLVRRCFKAERPNACWLSDVTYIPTREGWLYLAAVLDVYSRAIVGWAMSHTLEASWRPTHSLWPFPNVAFPSSYIRIEAQPTLPRSTWISLGSTGFARA